jgi:hypothetical protein
MTKETHERERMRLLGTLPKTAIAPAALSNITVKIAVPTRCSGLEPRGPSEEEKDLVYRACSERGSKRAVSRIFGTGRCCTGSLARQATA